MPQGAGIGPSGPGESLAWFAAMPRPFDSRLLDRAWSGPPSAIDRWDSPIEESDGAELDVGSDVGRNHGFGQLADILDTWQLALRCGAGGAERMKLAMWCWFGALATLAALAATSRRCRYLLLIWCGSGGTRVVDRGRRLVSVPRDRPFDNLFFVNGEC